MGARAGLMAVAIAVGALVGLIVMLASRGAGVDACGADLEGECARLVQSFALRSGLLVGGVTVMMQLTVAGLLRMVSFEEERRLELENLVAGEPVSVGQG